MTGIGVSVPSPCSWPGELLVISDVWHVLHAGLIVGESRAGVRSVLLSVITNMTSSWEHIGIERPRVPGEEMGCLTDSQRVARIFPDSSNTVILD